MADDPFIFIRWGRFQAGAFGRFAILLALAAVVLAARLFGLL